MGDAMIRLDLVYTVPQACRSARDVLVLLRTPAWVRFVMRFAAPRIKVMSPSDRSVLARLALEWRVPHFELLRVGATACTLCRRDHAPSSTDCNDCAARLPCGHVFHFVCARTWLQQRSTCPVCQFALPKALDGTYAVQGVHSALVLDASLAQLDDTSATSAPYQHEFAAPQHRVRVIVTVRLEATAASGAAPPCQMTSCLADTNGEALDRDVLQASPTLVEMRLLPSRMKPLARCSADDFEWQDSAAKAYDDPRASARNRCRTRLSVLDPPRSPLPSHLGRAYIPHAKRMCTSMTW